MNRLIFATVALAFLISAAFAFSSTEYIRTIQNAPAINPTIYIPVTTLLNNSSSQAGGGNGAGIDGDLKHLFGIGLSGIKDALYDKNGNLASFKYQDENGVWHTVTDIQYDEMGRIVSYNDKSEGGTEKRTSHVTYNTQDEPDSYDYYDESNLTYHISDIQYNEQGMITGYDEEGMHYDGFDKKTIDRTNVTYNESGQVVPFEKETEGKGKTTGKNFKYDEQGRVVSYTEETTDSSSPDKKTETTHYNEYNNLGQVENETTIDTETGNKTDAGKVRDPLGGMSGAEIANIQAQHPDLVSIVVLNNSTADLVVKRHAKLFGFIPVDYDIGVQVNPEGVQKVEAPWWAIFTDDKLATATAGDIDSLLQSVMMQASAEEDKALKDQLSEMQKELDEKKKKRDEINAMKGEKANLSNQTAGAPDSLGEMSSEDQLKLQQMMDRKSQLESMISNVMKAAEDTQGGIVGNLKAS